MQWPTKCDVTPREYEVWELIAHGATYRDIAHILRGPTGKPLSVWTVKNYVSFLRRKVGVDSSNELIVVWYEGELLHAPRPEVQPVRVQPTALRARATLFPTKPTRTAALAGLTDEERQKHHDAHPWLVGGPARQRHL